MLSIGAFVLYIVELELTVAGNGAAALCCRALRMVYRS
jgi:hypothetical protein